MRPLRPTTVLALLVALYGAGGCGWVDATGRQPGDPADDAPAPSGVPVPPMTPGTPMTPAIPTTPTTAPLVLIERTRSDVRLDGDDGTLEGWRWQVLDEPGDPEACAAVAGFDRSLAERRLVDACSEPDDCALAVEERRDALGTRFTLELPPLRAPLAARVALAATDADGRAVERRRTLCGLSVNEAPEAGDDRFEITVGTTLDVAADDPDALLANDVDDDDVRNAPLSIDPTPVRAPRHAALFELGTDGGFVYRPRDDALEGDATTLEDGFAYRLGDGLHEVVGEVVIVVSADDVRPPNRPPRALGPVPDIEVALDPLRGAELRVDLAVHFDDPDGDALRFAVAPGSLPPGGTLALTADGVLAGRLGSADLGRWRVTLLVGDGDATIERDFTLDVVRAFEANAAPSVTDIANRVFRGRFDYDVAPYFDDPDGDRLRFSARGLPEDVAIDEAGRINGRSRKRNRGAWFVVVTADDGRGGTVADGFRLTIE